MISRITFGQLIGLAVVLLNFIEMDAKPDLSEFNKRVDELMKQCVQKNGKQIGIELFYR